MKSDFPRNWPTLLGFIGGSILTVYLLDQSDENMPSFIGYIVNHINTPLSRIFGVNEVFLKPATLGLVCVAAGVLICFVIRSVLILLKSVGFLRKRLR